MSTHNMCFCGEIKKISIIFSFKKKNKKKTIRLSGALIQVHTSTFKSRIPYSADFIPEAGKILLPGSCGDKNSTLTFPSSPG